MDFPKDIDTINMRESIFCLNKHVMPTSQCNILRPNVTCLLVTIDKFYSFFLPYMGMATILVTGQVSRTLLNELLCPHLKMYLKYEKNWLSGFIEDI